VQEDDVTDRDVTQMKEALASFKRDEARASGLNRGQRQSGDPAEIRRQAEDQRQRLSDLFVHEDQAFRQAVTSRLKGHDQLATGVSPGTPTFTKLDTPFLIWAFHDYGPSNILTDTHVEPLNSWAKFRTHYSEDGPGNIGDYDEVAFYFLWQNDTGSDAVVNVESQLLLMGSCGAYAEDGWFPGFLWLSGNYGKCRVLLNAKLTVLEWWNHPPTQPLRQPGQEREVTDFEVEGGFIIQPSGAKLGGESQALSGSYHLNYDGFRIPADAVAVFEVSLEMYYSLAYGSCDVTFDDPPGSALMCPYVELEMLTAPLRVSG
jgi:hypothetical protein